MIHSVNEDNRLEEEYSETTTGISLTGSAFPTFCTMPDRERQLYATDNPLSGGFLVDGESSFHHHQQGDFSSAVSSITFDDSFTTSATSSRIGGGKAFPTLAEDEEFHMTHDNNSSLGGTTISSRFVPGTTTRRRGRRSSMPDPASLIKGGDLLGNSNHRFDATGPISNSLASSHHSSSVPSVSHALCRPPRRRPSANSVLSGGTMGSLSCTNNSVISDATSGFTSFNEELTISTIETDLLDEDVSYLIASPSKSSRGSISLGSHGSAACNKKYGRRASMNNAIGGNVMYPRRLSPTLEADEPVADRDEETADPHLGRTLQEDADVTPNFRIPCKSRSPVANTRRRNEKRRQSITLEAATAPFGASANWAVQSDITLESFLFEDSCFLARDFEDSCAVDRQWGVGSSLTMTSMLEDYSSPNITSRRTSFNKGNNINSGGKDINGNHSSSLGGTTAPTTTFPAEDRVVSSRFANTCRALSPCSKPERSESQGTNSTGPLRGTLCGVTTKDGLGTPATTTGVVLKSKPPLVQPASSRTLASQESQQSAAPSMPTRRASVESSCSIASTILSS